MSKDEQTGQVDPAETFFDGDNGATANTSFERQLDSWRDPSTETDTVRMLIDAVLSCPTISHSDSIPSPPPSTTTVFHDTTAPQQTVAAKRTPRPRKIERQSWSVCDLNLARNAFAAQKDMRTPSEPPVATRASARLRKGKEREREPEPSATARAPALAVKRPKHRSELGDQRATTTLTSATAAAAAGVNVVDEPSAPTIDYATDKANLIEAIESRAAALRHKERHTMASLYKARVERQILLTARQTIDLRLRELNARRIGAAVARGDR